MCPWKYPAMMIDNPNKIHARKDSISGTVGLGFDIMIECIEIK